MEKNLTVQRKREIINACEKLYQTKGFREVTIKEISKETSFSRPSIYNYFETKEEIFLALLTREYNRWIDKLKEISYMDRKWDRETFAKALASTLKDQEIMLKIQTMNLYEIEENSRMERLEEYKRSFYQAMQVIDDCLIAYKQNLDESARINFRYAFFPFLYGIYSYAHPTEKQLDAMNHVGIPRLEMTIYDLAWHCIWKLLP